MQILFAWRYQQKTLWTASQCKCMTLDPYLSTHYLFVDFEFLLSVLEFLPVKLCLIESFLLFLTQLADKAFNSTKRK